MAKQNQDPDEIKKKALETASIIEDALRSIADNVASSFEAAMSGMDKVSQSTAKEIQARFNKMAKVTDDISSNAVKLQQGLLSVKGVKDQILQRTIKENALATQLVTHLTQETGERKNIAELIEEANTADLTRLTDEQKKRVQLVKEYVKSQAYNQDYIEQLKEQQAEQEKINKKLGASGSILKGISKIPILGNLVDTDKALEAMNAKIAEGGDRTAAFGAGLKSLGKDIAKNVTDPLTITVFLAKNFLTILTGADKATGELAKGMNMSYTNAASLRTELSGIASSTGDAFVNTRTLQESLMAVGQSLGTNAKLNKEDLVTMTQLREEAGFTNEELIGIQKLTLSTGGNLKDNTKQFYGTVKALSAQNGLMLNEKQLLKEVSNTSASIKLSIGGTTKQLAEAAVKAKQFGINLQQADQISKSLLDFESSITNELEAELITGKDLNLEKARLLALNGDIAGASAEILKQVGGTAEFSKMNRIQQEAIAKATGLSRDELAASLIEREALQKIGAKDAAAAKEKYENLRKTMTAEEAAKALGDESYAQQLEQTSNSEKFEKIIEKIRDAFTPIAEELLPKISAALEWFSKHTNVILGTMTAIGAVIGVQMVGGMIKATAQMAPLIAKAGVLVGEYVAMAAAWAIANPIGAAAGLLLAAGVGAVVYSQMQDGEFDKSGKPTLFTGKDAVKILPEDSIYAAKDGSMKVGTNLLGNDVSNNSTINNRKADTNSSGNAASNSGTINVKVENQITAGNTIITLDGIAIAKAMTPYIIEQMRQTSVKVQ
jgi:hypothetical protein